MYLFSKKSGLFMIFQTLGVVLLQSVIYVGACLAQEWKNLKPLITKKSDVKKLFKNPIYHLNYFETYETEDGRINIRYSHGYCREKDGLKWNIRPNIITAVEISPTKSETLETITKKLEIDLTTFIKKKHPTIEDSFAYFSRDESLILETYFNYKANKEDIYNIQIRPSKYKQNLLCK